MALIALSSYIRSRNPTFSHLSLVPFLRLPAARDLLLRAQIQRPAPPRPLPHATCSTHLTADSRPCAAAGAWPWWAGRLVIQPPRTQIRRSGDGSRAGGASSSPVRRESRLRASSRRLKLSSLASSGADPGGLAARKLSRRRHRLFFPEQQVGSTQLSFRAVVSPSSTAQPSAGTTRSQEEQVKRLLPDA